MVVNPSRATAADKPVVVVLRQGGRRYPGNSGGPGNGGGIQAGQLRPISRWWWYCAKAAAGIRATPEAQVTVVVNPSRAAVVVSKPGNCGR